MKRDWDAILKLIDITEKLAGHPNLKLLRDQAMKDLNDLVDQPSYPKTWVPEVGPADMAGATPLGATGPTEVHPLGSGVTGTTGATGHYIEPELKPGEHVQDPIDHKHPHNVKLNPELIPTGDNISDPIVRRKV